MQTFGVVKEKSITQIYKYVHIQKNIFVQTLIVLKFYTVF